MVYFPFFIDIEDADGLIIGEGKHANEKIEEWLPDNIEVILEYMEAIRPEMKEKYPDRKERAKVLRVVYESMVRR